MPLCPVATEELLCLRVDKSVHTSGHAPIWLSSQQRASISHVPVVKLKLKHNYVDFRPSAERDNQGTRWKSTRIVRPSGSLNVTNRPLSCRCRSVPRLDCTRELRSDSVFVKDTTRWRLIQTTDSFPQSTCLPLPLPFLWFLPVCV